MFNPAPTRGLNRLILILLAKKLKKPYSIFLQSKGEEEGIDVTKLTSHQNAIENNRCISNNLINVDAKVDVQQ